MRASSVFAPLVGGVMVAATLGVATPASAAPAPNSARVQAPDFNGDGFTDVVIGEPRRDVNGISNAGAVRVIYGRGPDLPLGGTEVVSQLFTANTTGVPGVAETNGFFGYATAMGDFDGDDIDDLAIGAPDNNSTEGGSFTILYGNQGDGLIVTGAQRFTAANVCGGCRQTGIALAAGDGNNDGRDDLAVGASGYSNSTGAVGLFLGSATGITQTGRLIFTQNSGEIPGANEPGDEFGRALAFGDFNDNGLYDLAIGVPGEDIGSVSNAGGVVILPGSNLGVSAFGSRAFNENTSGVPDVAQTNDRMGQALSAGDANLPTDLRDDLVVGVPGEHFGSVSNGGAVIELRGAAGTTLMTATGSRFYSQNTTNVPGSAETGDRFGAAVDLGDLNADGFVDLAVGTPGEAIGSLASAGAVVVMLGTASGIGGTGSTFWSQDGTFVDGNPETNDQFGASVRIYNPEPTLTPTLRSNMLVGAPGEDSGTGVVHLFRNYTTGFQAESISTQSAFSGGLQAGSGFGASLGL